MLLRALPLLVLAALPADAQDPLAPAGVPATKMLVPGKALVSDDLAAPLGKEWKVAKGKWEVSGGAVRVAELPADMHGAVARRDVALRSAVIEYGFKLDGAKVTTLSVNGPKGHVCRVLVRPTGLTVQKDDQDGKKGDDKAVPLATVTTPVTAGEWHTLVVELRGADLLATLDGRHTAFGSHPAIDAARTNLGLTVAGESASFRRLRVWEAEAVRPDWESTRAGLGKKN
ncbi:hypothetical protein J0H58_06500 [bacterium]|nr:hypothetical protein [bacterium]